MARSDRHRETRARSDHQLQKLDKDSTVSSFSCPRALVIGTCLSFICNFARLRAILGILWHDDVYPFVEISEVVKQPYRVSNGFIEAAKNLIDKLYPSIKRKPDGTKILIIEKETAIMGDLFFAHVDNVSRRLFDLSPIHERFSSPALASYSSKK